ncbi:ABC transporter ATP-binding protein [Marinovum sp.]|uniref:ABC transporter ATP-binding protein n=1 Tax=Marinovum sp. TaxID=2024839 RepID=UPI003A90C7D4
MSDTPILSVRDLQKTFGAVVAAKDITVDVPAGQVVGVIGANGAGKTTFVNMVTGYLKPSAGTIRFAGEDITGIPPRDAVHRGLTRSFQVSQVFMSLSVRQNLLSALALARRNGAALLRPIRDPALMAECEEVMARYGLTTVADSDASALSQGSRKLLDIAMAVVSGPKMLLLDEPTSGVAAEEKFAIMDTVMNALKATGTTVLFIEHDMEIVERYVDRVLAFFSGEVICDAPPAQALVDPKVRELVIGDTHTTTEEKERAYA